MILAVWVLLGLAATGETNRIVMIDGTERNAGFGLRIFALGDANRDGLADFAIAEPKSSAGVRGSGRTHVVLGRRGDRAVATAQILDGSAIAAAGDADGDGHADLLAVTCDPAREAGSERRLALYRGRSSGFDPVPAWSMAMDWDPACEYSVASGGDLNGDGLTDLAIGIVSSADRRGEVRVFLGRGREPWATPDWVLQEETSGESFGDSVAFVGDVNGDGFADLLVGAPHSTLPNAAQGRAYLFAGSKSGPGTSPAWTAGYPLQPRRGVDNLRGQFFGRHLAAAGDVNRDGFADVLIPAIFAGQNDGGEGLVFCYLGSSTGLDPHPAWSAEANREHALFGWSVGAAGDVDRDGFGDVIVGARHFEHGQPREGLAALYRGNSRGIDKSPVWTFESNRSADETGRQVVGLGDLDGDGFVDLAVSSPGYHEPPGSEEGALGRVRVLFGSAVGFADDSGIRFEKTLRQWVNQEWERLSFSFRVALFGVAAACFFAAGLWAREAWRRRTIVLVEKRERESRLDERARIARDLHDELGSQISRITILTESMDQGANDVKAELDWSQELKVTARDLRTAVEQIVTGLRHDADSLSALVELVSRQSSAFFSGTPVRCLEDVPARLPALRIPGEIQRQLSAAIREALANTLKHSHARELWIRVRWDAPWLRFEIEDDGIGFRPESATGRGRGLTNMRERMNAIGARIEIHSQPGHGSRLCFEVGLEPADDPESRPPFANPERRQLAEIKRGANCA